MTKREEAIITGAKAEGHVEGAREMLAIVGRHLPPDVAREAQKLMAMYKAEVSRSLDQVVEAARAELRAGVAS